MLLQQKFESLIILTFCLFLANGFIFTADVGVGAERFPFHRYLIVMEAFLFAANFRRLLPLLLRNAPVLLLPIYVLVTSLWAFDTNMVLKNTIFLLISLMLGLQAAAVYVRKPVLFLLAGGAFLCLLIITSFLLVYLVPNVGIDIENFGRPRWVGITDHPNKLGVLCMLSIWFGLAILVWVKSRIGKIIAIGLIIVSGFVLAGADSKTSMITSILLCVSVWYILFIKNRVAKIILLFALLTAFSLATFNLDLFKVESISAVTGRDVTTLTGRTTLWQSAIEAIGVRPIGGWGFGGLDRLSSRLGVDISHFHNGYLQLFVQGGMVALMLLIIIAALMLKKLAVIKKEDRKSYAIFVSGLIMVLVHNVAESTLIKGLHPLWIVTAFLYFSIGIEAFKLQTTEFNKRTANKNTNDDIIKKIIVR